MRPVSDLSAAKIEEQRGMENRSHMAVPRIVTRMAIVPRKTLTL